MSNAIRKQSTFCGPWRRLQLELGDLVDRLAVELAALALACALEHHLQRPVAEVLLEDDPPPPVHLHGGRHRQAVALEQPWTVR